MKIRILLDAKQIGGVETHVMNLCEDLVRHHHDCKIIFVCNYPNNILYALCDKKGLKYTACHSFKELVTALIKDRPDVIHTHGYKANIYARFIGRLYKIPVVTTFHAGEKPVGRLKLYNFLDRWSSFLSTNIAVNTEIAKKLPSPATTIPNFVTMPELPNTLKAKPPFDIFFIGRISPEKGPLRFCEMAKSTSAEFNWHMVGTGPLAKECQKKYRKYVQFHGAISDMDLIWPKVDLLCITSTYEGLPLVLLEAMSRGIPVISFDVGSVKEVLSEPKYIIECYKLEMMQKRISEYFAQSMEERELIAKKEIERIQLNFSKDAVVPRIEAVYSSIVGNRPTASY
ncbi:MAG: glycosyltransferase family 4 protein [Legionella sp.]|jgi:glycosyltransferase involved in cell wall biosynthesis